MPAKIPRFPTWVGFWCLDPGSNRGPPPLQGDALPTELSKHYRIYCPALYEFISFWMSAEVGRPNMLEVAAPGVAENLEMNGWRYC